MNVGAQGVSRPRFPAIIVGLLIFAALIYFGWSNSRQGQDDETTPADLAEQPTPAVDGPAQDSAPSEDQPAREASQAAQPTAPTAGEAPAQARADQPESDQAEQAPEAEQAEQADQPESEQAEQAPEAEQAASGGTLAEATPADRPVVVPADGPVVVERGADATSPAGSAPSFDVVQVSPDGSSVVAGRAVPGATVKIMDGAETLGEVTADGRGEWVFVPTRPLPVGTRQLGLAALLPDGTEVLSREVVVVVVDPAKVEDRAESAGAGAGETMPSTQPLAVLLPRDGQGPSRVLQRSRIEEPVATASGLTLGVIDYDEAGQVDLSGQAQPKQMVTVYLDNRLVGRAQADDRGEWRLVPVEKIDPGTYTLRVDQLDTGGSVVSRIETPFAMADLSKTATGEGLIVVQPGNSLWRIARRVYGSGVRYTVIFEANQDQIRDPHKIYPGQIFLAPQGG